MREEGMQARWDRHQRMAERTWQWVDEMNERGVALSVLAPPGARSPTVTTIRLPEPWSGPRVVAAAREHGFGIATGYGKLRESCFRIGHMGDHTLDSLDALLETLSEVLT